jgi:rhodanese-related sulfurtransferase
VRAARTLREAGAILLDVRGPGEWQDGHAPGAVLIPMGEVQARRDELPGDNRIVVVCRSAAITGALRAHGYDAVNLTGALTHGMVVHCADPLNCETAIPALIGGVIMANAPFYVRNHFQAPMIDASAWRLEVTGLVERPLALSLRELSRMPAETASSPSNAPATAATPSIRPSMAKPGGWEQSAPRNGPASTSPRSSTAPGKRSRPR